jgi:hypothetical protein
MFQDSIELCTSYNHLSKENELIKSELGKVDVSHSIYTDIKNLTTESDLVRGRRH